MPTPSAPGSCSGSARDGPFEEFPTSTSSPVEVSLDLDASEEMVGSRVGDANCSPLASNHSPQQGILQSHVDQLFHRGDSIPGIALPRDAGNRTSSAVIIPDFESVSRDDQLSTADLCFAMNGTLDLESYSAPNMSRSSSKELGKRPRLERSRLLSLPSSQSVNQMPGQLEYADQVSNTFQEKPPLDNNQARPFEDLTSWPWNIASQDVHSGALNEFQLEALGDENLARPFADLTSWPWNTASQDVHDGALNEFQLEALGDENLARPFADLTSWPWNTASQDVHDGALNEFQLEALGDENLARSFADVTSWPWNTASQDVHNGALNEFQLEALGDENLARPFADLDDEALTELYEFLTNENLAHPFKDHCPRSLGKDTGPQIVDEEALNAGPFEFTFSQPPSWDMGSQGFDQGSSSFQDTSPTTNDIAHHSTRLFSDDELRYMSEGWNGSRFLTAANTSHAQPTSHRLSQFTGFVANETFNNLQNEICAN
jgi:hypothetical protein